MLERGRSLDRAHRPCRHRSRMHQSFAQAKLVVVEAAKLDDDAERRLRTQLIGALPGSDRPRSRLIATAAIPGRRMDSAEVAVMPK